MEVIAKALAELWRQSPALAVLGIVTYAAYRVISWLAPRTDRVIDSHVNFVAATQQNNSELKDAIKASVDIHADLAEANRKLAETTATQEKLLALRLSCANYRPIKADVYTLQPKE